MRKLLFVVSLLLASGLAVAQTGGCSSGSTGGSNCVAPLTVTPPSGTPKTTTQEWTPQTTAEPCPGGIAVKDGTFVLCSQKTPTATLLVDYGDGKGYVPISVPGATPTVAVGSTATLPPGSNATVTNSGTPTAAIFNFGVPQGTGGPKGDPGSPGLAATVAAGSVTNLPPGSQATVMNAGNPNAAIFNFGIPQGAPGLPGTNGINGTNGTNGINGVTPQVAIGAVTTLPSGSPATATNTGIPPNVLLNLGIPQGPPGTMSMPAGCDFTITALDVIAKTGHIQFGTCK